MSWNMGFAYQKAVVGKLLGFGLIKVDPTGKLPLKTEGRTTDIYINLRGARNHPEAILFLSNLYTTALHQVKVDRFVEIPDSISCLAGVISTMSNYPYITIREESKPGRISSKVIGNPIAGETVAIIDDVITDGESKIKPHKECLRLGLEPKYIIVLVDREEGWEKKLEYEGVKISVRSGMKLTFVRKCLIEMGLLPNFQKKSR